MEPIFMTAQGGANFLSVLIPFVLAAAVASITFFVLKAIRKKKHPTEEDVKETNRQRKEREKLKRQTTEKVNAVLSGNPSEKEHTPNGLRSGKHNKKKKK